MLRIGIAYGKESAMKKSLVLQMLVLLVVSLAAGPVSAQHVTHLSFATESAVDCSTGFAWGCNFLGSPARTSAFTVPGATGLGLLQSWTISPDPGIGLDGVYSYVYRVSLANVVEDGSLPKGSPDPCVSSVKVPFGPVFSPYNNPDDTSVTFDAYMLARSYGGTSSLTSVVKTNNVIEFFFDPVCAGTGGQSGETTMIFGVTSSCTAETTTADVFDSFGNVRTLAARTPQAFGSDYVWPLSGCTTLSDTDTMGTSYGPRINNDEWDFHNGIDLPPVDDTMSTPVFAARGGTVVRAGEAGDNGYSSRHLVIQDADGRYMVYLHLEAIESPLPTLYPDPANPGAPATPVHQGQRIGWAGDDGASHTHLHFEIRESLAQVDSTHPLNYLEYTDSSNFTAPVLDGLNRLGGQMAARLLFEAPDRLEGDLLKVEVDLIDSWGMVTDTRMVDLEDETTFSQSNSDTCAFVDDIALEGYQSANMQGDERVDLQYGIVLRNLSSDIIQVQARVHDVGGNTVQSALIPITAQTAFERATDFQGTFPPAGWQMATSGGATVSAGAINDANGMPTTAMMCEDYNDTNNTRDVAALEVSLPGGRFEWIAEGEFQPTSLDLNGKNLYALHFLNSTVTSPTTVSGATNTMSVAARIRKVGSDWLAGVIARNPDGSWPSDNGPVADAEIVLHEWDHWSLHLRRLGTREAGATLFINGVKVATESWDSTAHPPNTFRAGMGETTKDAAAVIWADDLDLSEDTPSGTMTCTP